MRSVRALADRLALHHRVAAARARPAAAPSAAAVRVYVWDLVVRLTHWTIAASILVLGLTGFYIGNPFFGPGGPASPHAAMTWARLIHFYASIAFGVAVLARLIWMFIGPREARWNQLLPTTRRRWRDLLGTLQFYAFLRDRPPPARGHNALAGFAYLFVFALYLFLIATGLGLYAASAHVGSYTHVFDFVPPLLGGLATTRWLHHLAMWVVALFVVQHIYTAWLTSRVEKNGTIDSIFSGYKFLPQAEEEGEEPRE